MILVLTILLVTIAGTIYYAKFQGNMGKAVIAAALGGSALVMTIGDMIKGGNSSNDTPDVTDKEHSSATDKAQSETADLIQQKKTEVNEPSVTTPEPPSRKVSQTPASPSKVPFGKATQPPTPSHSEANTPKDKIALLKGELAAVESKIGSERNRWRVATNTINRLTNFKKTPVKEGSRAYYQCVEAAKVIRSVEAGAPALKAQKAKLMATIESLESSQ